jgi:hypothetical protein
MSKCHCYPHVEDLVYEICMKQDIYDVIITDADKFAKFDAILDALRDTYAVKIQNACNEVFGEDAIFVM